MKKTELSLVGDTFTHLTGGNKGYSVAGKVSKNIVWTKDERDITFYVDDAILLAQNDNRKTRKFGWLLESESVMPHLLNIVKSNESIFSEIFEIIFTHHKSLLDLNSKLFKWVPAQGFWIKNPMIYPKSKLVSMISSSKAMSEGHKYRLQWVDILKDKVDLYGRGIKEIETKEDGLCDYMFSVAIENGRYETYFTEKILDCFATGTIPIYIGAPDIGDHFNKDGIIQIGKFDTISADLYYDRMDSIKENLELAKKMEVLEDFIWENYLQKII